MLSTSKKAPAVGSAWGGAWTTVATAAEAAPASSACSLRTRADLRSRRDLAPSGSWSRSCLMRRVYKPDAAPAGLVIDLVRIIAARRAP